MWSSLTDEANEQPGDFGDGADSTKSNCVLIVDCIGELKHIYRIASLVFIGGTFIDIGGHNFIEAVANERPVILGPYTRNFAEDVQAFLEANAIIQIQSKELLAPHLDELFAETSTLEMLGKRAGELFLTHIGSVERTAEAIISELRGEADHVR